LPILATSVAGSLVLAPAWMKSAKSSRASQDAWAMISRILNLEFRQANRVGGAL